MLFLCLGPHVRHSCGHMSWTMHGGCLKFKEHSVCVEERGCGCSAVSIDYFVGFSTVGSSVVQSVVPRPCNLLKYSDWIVCDIIFNISAHVVLLGRQCHDAPYSVVSLTETSRSYTYEYAVHDSLMPKIVLKYNIMRVVRVGGGCVGEP